MPRAYELDTVLVISTQHMQRDDLKLLQAPPIHDMWVIANPYGWHIFLPYQEFREEFRGWLGELKQAGFSTTFLGWLKRARLRKCNWLRLDCDGPTYHWAPVFDHEKGKR